MTKHFYTEGDVYLVDYIDTKILTDASITNDVTELDKLYGIRGYEIINKIKVEFPQSFERGGAGIYMFAKDNSLTVSDYGTRLDFLKNSLIVATYMVDQKTYTWKHKGRAMLYIGSNAIGKR